MLSNQCGIVNLLLGIYLALLSNVVMSERLGRGPYAVTLSQWEARTHTPMLQGKRSNQLVAVSN